MTYEQKHATISNQLPVLKKDIFLRDEPIFQNAHTAWKEFQPDTPLSSLHMHDFIEIFLVVGGSGMHCVWNETTPCRTGDVFIINTGVPHDYFYTDKENAPVVKNLLIDPDGIYGLENASLPEADNPHCLYGIFSKNISAAHFHLNDRQFRHIYQLYQEIEAEVQNKQHGWLPMVASHLTQILLSLQRFSNNEQPAVVLCSENSRKIVSEAIRLVTNHYADSDLTLFAVANTLHISKSYLSRLFQKVTGEHFSDYLKSVRLKKACQLLAETQLTNEQIIDSCGFHDIPTFYKLFKAQFSITPYQYRLENKNST